MIKDNYCAVIPAYEPDERLTALAAEAAGSGFSVFIVDDGSGPSYQSIFDEAARYARVISYPKNCGKGHAMKAAFAAIRDELAGGSTGSAPDALPGDCTVVVIDCDGKQELIYKHAISTLIPARAVDRTGGSTP